MQGAACFSIDALHFVHAVHSPELHLLWTALSTETLPSVVKRFSHRGKMTSRGAGALAICHAWPTLLHAQLAATGSTNYRCNWQGKWHLGGNGRIPLVVNTLEPRSKDWRSNPTRCNFLQRGLGKLRLFKNGAQQSATPQDPGFCLDIYVYTLGIICPVRFCPYPRSDIACTSVTTL